MNFPHINTAEDWKSFFIEELNWSKHDAEEYAQVFYDLKLTGSNIGIGLTKSDFLNHVNIPYGYVLELEAKFTNKVKVETTTHRKPMDKVPRPTICMNSSQLGFDQFKFEWCNTGYLIKLTKTD